MSHPICHPLHHLSTHPVVSLFLWRLLDTAGDDPQFALFRPSNRVEIRDDEKPSIRPLGSPQIALERVPRTKLSQLTRVTIFPKISPLQCRFAKIYVALMPWNGRRQYPTAAADYCVWSLGATRSSSARFQRQVNPGQLPVLDHAGGSGLFWIKGWTGRLLFMCVCVCVSSQSFVFIPVFPTEIKKKCVTHPKKAPPNVC